jgi:hypothetical protein
MSDRYEERIDAALAVLSQAQAPEGMEARLLAGLRTQEVDAASAQSASPTAGWFGGRGGLVWGGAAAAVVVLVGLLAVPRREVPAAKHPVAGVVAGSGLAVGGDARGVPEVKHGAERTVASTVPAERVRPARRGAPATQEIARADADLPSFPAPPAPLTEEERLLLKVVHSGDRIELAMLDPAIRNARAEDEKAEVRKFFGEVTDKGGSE